MDELLHHCLRELSFDGDLGCGVSRLGDFIVGFYSQNSSFPPQTVDDAFRAFVWSIIVQQPAVRVGVVPQGAATEVYVAPQTSAKRKVKAKGEVHVEEEPSTLEIIPDAASLPLEQLKRDYSDALRIAVDPETSFAAITGSHIKSSKLSPMVYTALQFVTRGRENGISVVDLGKKSGYDQKTCFYLIKQLVELGLVVKVRRGGVGSHFCIHKHFYENSPLWQQIRAEETRATEDHSLQAPSPDTSSQSTLKFDPMDARHLSSLPVVRARVVKLLKGSRNHMHPCNNILLTLGFSNPTKTDRRFFQTRIRELIQQGVIERVLVPNKKKKDSNSTIKCFRLVTSDGHNPVAEDDGEIVRCEGEGEDEDEQDAAPLPTHQEDRTDVKVNLTIHKQITDLLEAKGMAGMTLNELSTALCQFDKRTIELLLARAERNAPPSHLSDLGVIALMETHGRERRHRYFTVASYRNLVAQENLDRTTAEYACVDLSRVGGYAPLIPGLFYEDETMLFKYQDGFKVKGKSTASLLTKQGEQSKLSSTEPRGGVTGEVVQRKNKRKRDGDDYDDLAIDKAPKRKRGRPPKTRQVEVGDDSEGVTDSIPAPMGIEALEQTEFQAVPERTAKKRGRPRKNKPVTAPSTEATGPATRIEAVSGAEPIPIHFVAMSGNIGGDAPENTNGPAGIGSGSKRRDRSPRKNPPTSNNQELVVEPLGIQNDGHTPERRAKKRQRIESTGMRDTPMGDEHLVGGVDALGGQGDRPEAALSMSFTQRPTPAVAHFPELYVANFGDDTIGGSSNLASFDPSRTTIEPLVPLNVQMAALQPPQISDTGQRESSVPIDPSIIEEPSVPSTSSTVQNEAGRNDSDSTAQMVGSADQQQSRGPRAKVNVSRLRRENELYRVIEGFGGVTTLHTREFFDAHMALIRTMAQAGEATSSPIGARLDKRTATATIDGMVDRGRIKILKTSIVTPIGVSRPTSVVYLPDLEQAKLNDFLAALGRNTQPAQQPLIKKIDEPVEYGSDGTQVQRTALPLQLLQLDQAGDNPKERWSKNTARAKQLFSYDDDTVRAVLLTERTTLGQLYGFIVGKALRARKLHLSAIDALERKDLSSNIVSIDHRIVHLSYFCYDLTVSTYCALVSSLIHDEDLTLFLETEEGRETRVRDLPSNFVSVLQVGKSRSRTRFLDMLEMLQYLKLVTPLQPSDSDSPWITSSPNGEHPTKFDPVPPESWTQTNPSTAPMYWCFSSRAPLRRSASDETSPPFWKDSSVLSSLDASAYWRDLEEACTNHEGVQAITSSESDNTHLFGDNKNLARSLRRTSSWSEEYTLTWHQTQYLKGFIDTSTGNTPLQDVSGGEVEIQRISWVVSAPADVIRAFFTKARVKMDHELDKARRKVKRRSSKMARNAADAKVLLSKKAAESRIQREKDWDAIEHRVHPEPLRGSAAIRVRQIRTRFLQSASIGDSSKWEGEILNAVREATMAATKILKASHRPSLAQNFVLPPVASNPPEKSVEFLIAQQGPNLRVRDKRKVKGKDNGHEGPQRRHRFQWNRDYDELARDASAIIKARCRNATRLDWAAFEQVFPAAPRNTVRQRLAHIKETPGNEAYLSRLEDKWYDLWTEHRGTDLLPDEDPQSPSNFDLVKHVEFLRKHIDKNALRVGFALPHEKGSARISASVDELQRDWDIIENSPAVPPWDFMWNATVEEGREKQLLQQAFISNAEVIPAQTYISSDAVCLAESALKMVFGTPHEKYDPETASRLLHSVGESEVSKAVTNLLSRGILSKMIRDPQKTRPGRTLKISEMNQNALGGSIARDTFQDALAFEEIATIQDGSWQEWPLLASDGDIATLFQLVSDHKVEFRIDTSQAQAARSNLDWNSKKADDDQIEAAIHVRFFDMSGIAPQPSSPVSSPIESEYERPSEHGKTFDGDPACCKVVSSGLIDCEACLEDESSSIVANMDEDDKDLALRILAAVRLSGSNGTTKEHILTNVDRPAEQILAIIRRITESPNPLLFWAGYSSPILVSSANLRQWTVITSEIPRIRTFPRRWLDVFGSKMTDVWEAALRATLGVILFRPGITQAELRWRLRAVYDRQELYDILYYLQEEGFIKMRISPCSPLVYQDGFDGMPIADIVEERSIYWLIGDTRHWYQI